MKSLPVTVHEGQRRFMSVQELMQGVQTLFSCVQVMSDCQFVDFSSRREFSRERYLVDFFSSYSHHLNGSLVSLEDVLSGLHL